MGDTLEHVKNHRQEIIAIAARHGALNVSIFGSVARGENTALSDIDFVVDFEPGRSLFDQSALRDELQAFFGVSVDVASRRGLKERVRQEVLADAIPL